MTYRLSGQDILRIWELGLAQHPVERALTIVCVALPDMSRDVLASLRIGKRDALLFAIRTQTFGPKLNSLVECPACQERLEFSFDAAALGMTQEVALNETDAVQQVYIDDYEVQFRLPTSLDLAAMVGGDDLVAARHLLVQQCVLSTHKHGAEMAVEALPETVLGALANRMAECDPQAEVELALTCSACGHEWQTTFDIVSYFWTEICAQIKRLLHEVHILARAYGWRETDILSMSATRRQAYLEMVN